MQPLDAITLNHLANELDLKLAGGKINKVQQPSYNELLLHLWSSGETGRTKFYVSIDPQISFCALVDESLSIEIPKTPPGFCMLLRKHLIAGRIKQIKALTDERVLNIYLDNFNELGESVNLVLSIELMGKNSNIILYDDELKLIIGCAHGVSHEMSREREISIGYPYKEPPAHQKRGISNVATSEILESLKQIEPLNEAAAEKLCRLFSGVGKATWLAVFKVTTNPEEACELITDLINGRKVEPKVSNDLQSYSLVPGWEANSETLNGGVNKIIAHYYQYQSSKSKLESKKNRYKNILLKQREKLENRVQELQKEAPEEIVLLKQSADELMTAYSQDHEYRGNSIIIGIHSDEEIENIEINLDSGISLKENAQKYYQKYKKAKNRKNRSVESNTQLLQSIEFINEMLFQLEIANTDKEISWIKEDLESQGWLNREEGSKQKSKALQVSPPRYTSSSGLTIWVGRNAMQNDYIIKKLGKPWDIWFHARLVPGSHVLVQSEKRELLPEDLLEAAELAAYFSQARASAHVPIIYTQLRYVRKIPNSYPGHVTYSQEKEIYVSPKSNI